MPGGEVVVWNVSGTGRREVFAVKGFEQVMVMMVKRFLELPKKDVVRNLELVCYVFCVGEAYATGGGGVLGPGVDGERGLEKGLGLKWSKCATRGCIGEGVVHQGEGGNKPGGRSEVGPLLRDIFVRALQF